MFNDFEKQSLKSLPYKRYEVLKIEQRKVNNYGHIIFNQNYYSVPYQYIAKTLIIKCTATLLKIYDDAQQIAIQIICDKAGEFISLDEHKPPQKQRKTVMQYIQKL